MQNIFRRNLGYKVVSLVLAIVFWLWIISQTDSNGSTGSPTLNVPLVLTNQPSNIIVISTLPTITVSIDNYQQISVKDLYAYVDLTDAAIGEHVYQVLVNSPQGVSIKNISPANVVLKLDTVKDKIVPVVLSLSGTLESGFITAQPIITPSVVNIRGPMSILEKLENVVVEVGVTGMKESIRVVRPVIFKDTQGKGIFAADPVLDSLKAFPETVEVIVPVYPKGTASKTVPVKVSARGTPAKDLTVREIKPVPSQVELVGDEDALAKIEYLNLKAVDVSGLSSTKAVDISLNSISLPKGVYFAEGTKLGVIIDIGPGLINKTISGVAVEVRNIPQGLIAEPIGTIDVEVKGYADLLNTLKPGDIKAWIDATGFKEGTYSDTSVLWKVPAGVTMVNIPRGRLVLKSSASVPTETTGQAGKTDGEEGATKNKI